MVAALRLASRENRYGLAHPKSEKIITVDEAVENYLKILIANWTAKHGAKYAARNGGQINAVRRWAEFVGKENRSKI
ncbi:MAG: hypothetical protein ACR2N3_03050 [Pyrinomonadaceae bacterium]